MKKLTLSLMAILTVACFSLSASAANQSGNKFLSSDWTSNGNVWQNPMLTDTAGLAAYPVGNDSLDKGNLRQNVAIPLVMTPTGFYPSKIQNADEHYGIAPAWDGRSGDSNGMKFGNYRAYELPGVNDNTN
jgi:hypothetical protein